MAEIGLAAAMSGNVSNTYGNGNSNTVKHYYDKKSTTKGSTMSCKKKPGKK